MYCTECVVKEVYVRSETGEVTGSTYSVRTAVSHFTNRSNPWHNDRPNVNFQRDLNLMIEADREYLDNPTLTRLCAMVAELIFRWERLTHESSRMRGVSSSGSAPTQGKHSKGLKSSELDRHTKDESKAGDRHTA
jgi:hypothetical protein